MKTIVRFLGGFVALAAVAAFSPAVYAGSLQANSAASSGAQAGSVLEMNAAPGVNYSGGYMLGNTPAVMPGSIYTMNPCSNGAAVGGAGPGIGLTFSFSHDSDECQLQNWATFAMRAYAMTHDPRDEQWARGIMCAANPTVFKTAPTGMCQPEAGSKAVAAAVPASPVPPPVKTVSYHGSVVALDPDAPAYCLQGGVDPRIIPACVGAQAASEAYKQLHRDRAGSNNAG